MSKADPNQLFYIVADADLGGLIDLNIEGKDCLPIDEAIELAKERCGNDGHPQYVVECRVVRRVSRGKMRVETVQIKAAP